MGWCHEFGPQIAETCEHPMTAHSDHCECTVCGTVCTGRFAGCGAVWARGPREVSIDAPHLGRVESGSDRWRLPLVSPTAMTMTASENERDGEPDADHDVPVDEHVTRLEPPDVTTRFAVAQLELLNDRVAGLTGETMARTEAALDKVALELERLRTQRELDFTDQAVGIFGAVQTGADALVEFSKNVGEVADDLRSILSDALKAIGGTDGMAQLVASSAAELNETREEFAASLTRIERDITLLRRRANAEAKEAKKGTKLDDEQVAYIVDAVTDSVLAAIEGGRKKKS